MASLNNYQLQQQNALFTNNPSLRSDMKIGYYSNGDAVIEVSWIFDEKKEVNKVTLYRYFNDKAVNTIIEQ